MKRIDKIILLMWLLTSAYNVSAADKDMKPGMLSLGAFDLTPTLNVDESYNDNIFYSQENPKGSFITQVTGGGEIALRKKMDKYALRYSFLSSQYHDSNKDSYVDQFLGFTTHFEANNRNRIDFNTNAIFSHYMRGTVLSQGSIAQTLSGPDQYHLYNAGLEYRYGRVDAKGNLGMDLKWLQFTYDNRLNATQVYDRTQFEFTPGFFLRLSPDVYFTSQVQNIIVDYPSSQTVTTTIGQFISPQSYNMQRYLVGMKWNQTSKTKGSIRVGEFQEQIQSNSQLISTGGTSGLTWDGDIYWAPLEYSKFNLDISNMIQPSIGFGNRQLQTYNLGWEHEWPNRITTNLGGMYQTVSHSASLHTVSGTTYKLDVKYKIRDWVDLGVNYYKTDFQAYLLNSNSNQDIYMLYIHFK
ncbi:outer membrane beta-barrel protein [Methylomonas paludis]|uniref:Outer membrane beta-barrel protein n=1 Tax=Methylomonas paludis TaxID=1173101 RepID=A0A975R8J0_9GAMM|nr:outer membrane beta-barrel protein [Methylomonas paludis]QWF70052.1 outer membrane beta-barrel protein [Methylomonas paludis]